MENVSKENKEIISKVLDINPYKLPKEEVAEMVKALEMQVATMKHRLEMTDNSEPL